MIDLTGAIRKILAGLGAYAAGVQIKSTTIDLNLAAGAHTLFTGTAQVVILESLVITMPNDLASGITLTGITIQTNDATPQPLILAAQGLVANLTAENQLTWEGKCRLGVGKLIQLTIAGGAEGAAYVCSVDVQYRAIVSGGILA